MSVGGKMVDMPGLIKFEIPRLEYFVVTGRDLSDLALTLNKLSVNVLHVEQAPNSLTGYYQALVFGEKPNDDR